LKGAGRDAKLTAPRAVRVGEGDLAKGEAEERRTRLHELDQVLDALERLNLTDAQDLPGELRQRLEHLGIPVPPRPSFSGLIEAVWDLQEGLLISGGEPGGPAPLPDRAAH